MKKLYSIICALCVMHCALLQAQQTECSTIAEVKALANGTECLYTGIATTTYYDAFNGVIMQDATGTILLQSTYLTASNTEKVKVGMTITGIKGTFFVEDNTYMTRINVKKADAKSIEVKSENATFTVQTIGFDEYMKDVAQYSGVPVRFENVNIRPIEGTSNYEIYSLTTDNKLTVSFMNMLGIVIPARADLEGFLSTDYSGKIFRVGSTDVVTPYAYQTISNIRNAITEIDDKDYELLDTFTVTAVVKKGDDNIVYIQDSKLSVNPSNYAMRVLLPASVEVNVGNRITGLYGTLIPYTKGTNQKSATFTQNTSKDISIVSGIGQPMVLSKYIYELEGNNMQNASNYDAVLINFSGGVVTKNSDGTYSYVVANENGQGQKSISLKMVGVEDLSSYVGKSCPVQGVLDIAATYPENRMTLIMRSEKDFLEPIIEFETIADIVNAGSPVASGVKYKLLNPALVTYKFVKTQGTHIYFAIVEDKTAGIVLCFDKEDYTVISVGDSIIGISGVYDTRSITNILNVDEEQRKEIQVKNSKNPVVGIDVSLKDIIENKALYENRVVCVKNIVAEYEEDGDLMLGYFVQGDYRLQYTTGVNNGGFIYYDLMDITGVVDNCLIGEYFSIWPLSQEHIINHGKPVDVEKVEFNTNVYIENSTIFVETQVGTNISVFNLQGQCLYSQQSDNSITVIENIAEKMVIIKLDNVVYKFVVK